ncbi:arylsulfatase [Aporhodopirellula aestuarii]|uniref:Arylsulfatase n=1 Tax=Aporhodopirellula aestuarii TaxID=2950107 RepID=A0ABT0UDD3_9BACT|nr:arylsulfatase [Aporhodopirellula aestuarii]MCM2374765.1 arylsulfatase [Aporhodopirellula aestuarii]
MRNRTLLIALSILAMTSLADATDGPNVVYILADDMGYSDLGCYGSEIETPNLDQLAEKGVRFTQFNNAAKCEPTRASLMSGQYWQDAGFGVRRGPTMGEVMKSAGYATFAVGKWHLDGNPVDRGFDRYFGHLSGGSHYFQCNASKRLDDKPFKEKPNEKFYMTDANADYAIRFIDEHHKQNPDTPFFMYLAFNAPHSPLHALTEDIEKYRDKYGVGWDKIREARYQKQIASGVTQEQWKLSPREASVPAWDSMREDEREYEATRMAIYAAMVDRMDQAIGRVVAKIRETGDEENTLVVFLSDNGGSASDVTIAEQTPDALLGPSGAGKDGYWVGLGWANASNTPFHSHKVEMGNGGVVTSCIASWPAAVKHPGSITDEPSHIIDLMATLVDVGDLELPTTFKGKKLSALPGKSLRPLLTGDRRESHEALYFHLFHNRAIVSGQWKLTTDWDHPWQLFNLSNDRTELTDVSSQHPEIAARLRKQWEDWYAEVPEKRFTDATGDPQYRRLDDPEESYLRRTGNGDERELVWRSKSKRETKNKNK